jgi:hypothetical protein
MRNVTRPATRIREIAGRSRPQSKTFVQVSTVLDLAFTPVGLPASANVIYPQLVGTTHIRWNPVYSGLSGESGGFGCPRLS